MKHSIYYQSNLNDSQTGKKVYEQINEEFANGPELNNSLLFQILHDNKDTEYGKKYGFADITSIEEYQKQVPVIMYDDIADDITKMCNGEQNVLTAYPCKHMNVTSGTIGKQKKIPMTQKQNEVFVKYNKMYLDGLKSELLDSSWMEGRAFCTAEGTHSVLPSGITVGSASSVMADFIRGGKETLGAMMEKLFSSPVEATIPESGTDTKYIHARFALMDKGLTGIISAFYSLVVVYFKYIDNNYKMLIDDIEKGTICDKSGLQDSVKESLMKKIKPMPERAAELREIFKNGPELCWVPLVWPNMQYITGVGGNSFAIYDKIIKTKYTGGCLKNIYSGVTASEGLWSIPSGIDTEDGIIAPQSAFFEFLPIEAENDMSKIVTMDSVEIGKVYELIVTNLCGFYRYRTNDAIIVTGFRGKTPLIRFMYRVNRTLNMMGEKTTEIALESAVEGAMDELGVDMTDFSVYTNYDEMAYDFLIEPANQNVKVSTDELSECIYKHMCTVNEVFGILIDMQKLSKPIAHWLKPHSSILYRDMMRNKGVSANQIKPVHVIMNELQHNFFYNLIMA